jgi:DNA-binding CsgD family transcriptional regulator
MTSMTQALLADLARLGVDHTELVPFRRAVLERLRRDVPFDAAIFHAFSPRVPLSTAALVGLAPDALAAAQPGWDALAVELAPMRELANRHGAAGDREAFPEGTASRARFLRLVARPFRMRRMAMVHLAVRGTVRSAIALFSRGSEAFDDRAIALLAALAPTIALADALLVADSDAPRAAARVALRCEDGRLTARQRGIVEHVAMGHTNEQIAAGLGLSPSTVRNHLAEVFRRLGASNRADLVRLAVLTPAPGDPR